MDMREIKSRKTLTLFTRKTRRSAADMEQTTGVGEFCLFVLAGGSDHEEICVCHVKFEILHSRRDNH